MAGRKRVAKSSNVSEEQTDGNALEHKTVSNENETKSRESVGTKQMKTKASSHNVMETNESESDTIPKKKQKVVPLPTSNKMLPVPRFNLTKGISVKDLEDESRKVEDSLNSGKKRYNTRSSNNKRASNSDTIQPRKQSGRAVATHSGTHTASSTLATTNDPKDVGKTGSSNTDGCDISTPNEQGAPTPAPEVEISETDDCIMVEPNGPMPVPQIDPDDSKDCVIIIPNKLQPIPVVEIESSDSDDCFIVPNRGIDGDKDNLVGEVLPGGGIPSPQGNIWSHEETVRFYRALAVVGTDFHRIKMMIPERSKLELKCKYKEEKKMNKEQVLLTLAAKASDDLIELRAELMNDRNKFKD